MERFLFDRDFNKPEATPLPVEDELPTPNDEVEAQDEVEEEPPAPTFSEEELGFAKATAFQDGRAEAQREMAQSQEAKLAELLDVIVSQLAALDDRRKLASDRREAAVAELVLRTLEVVLPAYAKKYGIEEIKEFVTEALMHLKEDISVRFTVAAEQVKPLRAGLAKIKQEVGMDGELVVEAGEGLAVSDVKMEWVDGGALRSVDEIWASIGGVLGRKAASRPAAVGKGAAPRVKKAATKTGKTKSPASGPANDEGVADTN